MKHDRKAISVESSRTWGSEWEYRWPLLNLMLLGTHRASVYVWWPFLKQMLQLAQTLIVKTPYLARPDRLRRFKIRSCSTVSFY